MTDIPIPTATEVGQGLSWWSAQSNGGTLTLMAVVAAALAGAVYFVYRQCRLDNTEAWARVTEISKDRTNDALSTVKALADANIALNRLADRIDISDRRGTPR